MSRPGSPEDGPPRKMPALPPRADPEADKPEMFAVPIFAQAEDRIREYWERVDGFEARRWRNKDGPCLTLYDGPPFAPVGQTISQLITTAVRDVVLRYWSMRGCNVTRLCGGQTHGHHVAYQLLRQPALATSAASSLTGIDRYTAEYKAIADESIAASTLTSDRLGACLKFCDNNKTMDPAFMETCWRLFKRLFDGGHVYRACRITPYSNPLHTQLSHMECAKDTSLTFMSAAAVISFPLVGVEGREKTSLLSYTLSPWTLLSNLLLGVDPDMEYREILDKETEERYILGEGRFFSELSSNTAKYEVLGKIPGKSMVGWAYDPPFDPFVKSFPNCFRIIAVDDLRFVEGTGVRHLSPAFSQRDFDAATSAGFLDPHQIPPSRLDQELFFAQQPPNFVGQGIEDASTAILDSLARRCRVVLRLMVRCPGKVCRVTDQPVLRRAMFSWFIKVTDSIPGILENLESTNWTPPSAKTAFVNRMANTYDWNISRDQYWGTPIPIWASDDSEEVVCVESIKELKRLSGFRGRLDASDRAMLDSISIRSKRGKGVLRRVSHVFDPWFEAGCMPYATGKSQDGDTTELLPADFIVSDRDSLGWFYALVVLGHKLFNATPFRNAIVPGTLLPNDVAYKRYYPQPDSLFRKAGADATRLYFVSSAVMRGKAMLLREGGIREMVSQILVPLWSTTFVTQVPIRMDKPENVTDRWILSCCQRLVHCVNRHLQESQLHKVVPELRTFFQAFRNIYIRLNRRRLMPMITPSNARATREALAVYIEVVYTLARLLAPLAPYLTEHMYQMLRMHFHWAEPQVDDIDGEDTIFALPFPTPHLPLIDETSERQILTLWSVLHLARAARHRRNVPLRTPLNALVVFGPREVVRDLIALRPYLRRELNVATVTLTNDYAKYGVSLTARPNWWALGPRHGADAKRIATALAQLTQDQLARYNETGDLSALAIDDPSLPPLEEDEFTLHPVISGPAFPPDQDPAHWEAVASRKEPLAVLLDADPTPEMLQAGVVREMSHQYQLMRYKAGFHRCELADMQFCVLENPGGMGVGDGFGGWWNVMDDVPGGRFVEGQVQDGLTACARAEEVIKLRGGLVVKMVIVGF